MKILIFIVAVALATLILVVKAIHTAAMFMDDSFRWGTGKSKEE